MIWCVCEWVGVEFGLDEWVGVYVVQVKADVTEGSDKLAEAIGDDSEAVVCATGFRPGWDLLAPWKVCQTFVMSW